MNKKTGVIIGIVVVAAIAAIALFWNQGSAERAQDKLDLAVKYVSEAKFEEAILAYNEAIKIDPKEPKAYQGLARVYTLQGKYDDAKGTYERGIDAVESQNQNLLKIGLGGLYIDWGKIAEAEKSFQEIKEANPKCMEAYWGLATVYKQKEDTAKAEEMLREAVAANPDENQAYNALALFLQHNGQGQEAIENLIKSLSLNMNQQEAYLVLTDLYEGNWPELINRAGGVSDQRIAAMLEFYSYYGAKEYEKALEIYDAKLKNESGNDKAAILAAIARVKTGDASRAEELIRQLAGRPIDDWLLSDLAEYYLMAGNEELAKQTAIKALEANGTNLEAVALLQRIGNNDESSRVYAARFLLYNWKPVSQAREELSERAKTFLDGTTDKKEVPKITSGVILSPSSIAEKGVAFAIDSNSLGPATISSKAKYYKCDAGGEPMEDSFQVMQEFADGDSGPPIEPLNGYKEFSMNFTEGIPWKNLYGTVVFLDSNYKVVGYYQAKVM